MNTTMADGAHDRLDAQIADALFGQPGMSKMDVANRVRELRGDGPALLGPREGVQDKRARFEAWAQAQSHRGGNIPTARDAGHPDVYAAPLAQLTWKSWQAALSAQPSPGNGERLLREVCAQLESLDCGACIGSHAPMEDLHGRIAQHLAGQPSPGGQGALLGYVHVEAIKALREDDEVTGVMVHAEERADSVPVYLAARQPVRYVRLPQSDLDLINEAAARQPEGATVKDSLTVAARQPVGQITDTEIDARLNALYREMVDSGQHNGGMSGVAWDRAVYRMAASQLVGEPVAWLVHWSDMPMESPEVTRSASRISEVSALTDPPRIVPLYAAPPAQAVDLGRVRASLQSLLHWIDDWAETPEESGIAAIEAEAEAVLALIDGKAVGK
ncbi:hypothetical protein ABE583_03045 [Stenotrophomonas sp. TWI143]|uniref:hypothetical protein n=1 Tax=Stenotrophomonas sp. TWI143 TaxID=3136771 RepID=UPI003207C484